MTKFILVYGTLKQGECNYSLLDGCGCQYVGKGVVPGCALVDLGGCPGMVLTQCDPNDFAQGEIYEAVDINGLLDRLDRFENEGFAYKRAMLQVKLTCRDYFETLDCWTYVYMPHLSWQFVPGGNWSLASNVPGLEET